MSVHARISDPLELRSDVLECAVISTDAIRSSENLKELSREKKKLKTQIKRSLVDLKKRVKLLEKSLPKVPRDEKVHAKREEMRALMAAERTEDLGGEIKEVAQVKEELDRIKGKHPKILRKKAVALEERERLRRELEGIRKRISGLSSN